MSQSSHRLSGVPANLLGAIFVLFAIVIFTFTLVFVKIIIPGHELTTGFKVAYNIINTVLATILARYASGEIQKQWLRLVNHEISNVKYHLHHSPHIRDRWRAILGINTFPERVKHIRSTALPQLTFIFTGLITAAVVAAVTLTDTTCHTEVPPPRIHSGADTKCTRHMYNISTDNSERSSPLWEFTTYWLNDDGSAYFATTNLGCPSWSGAQFLGAINTINPGHVAYARNGVGIQHSAIGVPEIFYTDLPSLAQPSDSLVDSSGILDQTPLRFVSHCLPVMARNPVKCRPGGNVNFTYAQPDQQPDDDTNFVNMFVDAGGCSFTQANSQDPNGKFGVMASRLCPTPNAVGKGTIAMGATGIISLTLAASVGDTEYLKRNAQSYDGIRNGTVKDRLKYAVSCDIDVQPTIRWRTVTLELRQGVLTSTPSYSKVISGIDGCEALTNSQANWTLGYGYAAGAVAALVPPLSEGRFWNGMTNTIFNQALNVTDTSDRYSTFDSWKRLIRNPPYGFNESTNALEDVFGLTTGITMGQMSTIDSIKDNSPLSETTVFKPAAMGRATFACTRVGSGNRSALLFTLPPLCAMAIAVYLLIVVPRKQTSFKTSRLDDLIGIGMASERELSMAYKVDHTSQSEDREVLVGRAAVVTPAPSISESRDGGEKVMGLEELRAVHPKNWD